MWRLCKRGGGEVNPPESCACRKGFVYLAKRFCEREPPGITPRFTSCLTIRLKTPRAMLSALSTSRGSDASPDLECWFTFTMMMLRVAMHGRRLLPQGTRPTETSGRQSVDSAFLHILAVPSRRSRAACSAVKKIRTSEYKLATWNGRQGAEAVASLTALGINPTQKKKRPPTSEEAAAAKEQKIA